jgi:PhzF family phenazine biosynthesis protein
MPSIPCWQVNAFTSRPFGGNPAAVCWLQEPAPVDWMQAVAAEMNLSETAYARSLGDLIELRWFTPLAEVDLCGHATLATAHALWSNGVRPQGQPLRFQTKSGVLTCTQTPSTGTEGQPGRIELDFPATPALPCDAPAGLLATLGLDASDVVFVGRTRFDLLVAVQRAETVRGVQPDMARLRSVPVRGVIVTALSDYLGCDFQSRFFAPAVGVDEDPVCGSAHCALAPFWGERLGKTELVARQVSRRVGELWLRREGDRVILAGEAVTVWRGEVVV